MSGHSKWSTIKRLKGALDAKRGKIFSKLAREIIISVKIGGPDPDMNPRLRMVILKCKSSNMPADNVDRAIKKGAGAGEGANFEELSYEIYGPHGVAVLVNVNTDNRNRTAAEMRHLLTKKGGNMATQGAVSRLFHRKGQIMVARESADEDTLMELALESGAEDFKAEEDGYEIITDPSNFEEVHQALEAKSIHCESAQVTQIAEMLAPLTSQDQADDLNKLLEALEEHDDVNEYYHNAQFPDLEPA